MKRLLAVFLAALLLWGCAPVDVPETRPRETAATDPVETMPTQSVPTQSMPTQPAEAPSPETLPAQTQPESYTLQLHAAVPIFSGPTYDAFCERIVGEDGVYTIVEEAEDPEGIRWGRLKSGAGWVDLAAAQVYTPVTAAFTDDALLQSGAYIQAVTDDSEYAASLTFRAREEVRGVAVTRLEPDMADFDGYEITETLYTIHELLPGMPLVVEVVFYGDMTAYGITFTTPDETIHFYAVTVSGRNGMLVMEEYTP